MRRMMCNSMTTDPLNCKFLRCSKPEHQAKRLNCQGTSKIGINSVILKCLIYIRESIMKIADHRSVIDLLDLHRKRVGWDCESQLNEYQNNCVEYSGEQKPTDLWDFAFQDQFWCPCTRDRFNSRLMAFHCSLIFSYCLWHFVAICNCFLNSVWVPVHYLHTKLIHEGKNCKGNLDDSVSVSIKQKRKNSLIWLLLRKMSVLHKQEHIQEGHRSQYRSVMTHNTIHNRFGSHTHVASFFMYKITCCQLWMTQYPALVLQYLYSHILNTDIDCKRRFQSSGHMSLFCLAMSLFEVRKGMNIWHIAKSEMQMILSYIPTESRLWNTREPYNKILLDQICHTLQHRHH